MSTKETHNVTYRTRLVRHDLGDYSPLAELPEGGGRYMGPTRFEIIIDVTGEPGIGHVELSMELVERRYRITKLAAEPQPGEGLDLAALARINPLEKVEHTVARMMDWEMTDGVTYSSEHPGGHPDPLRQVAAIYTAAYALGRRPTRSVADRLGISPNAAAQRVKRARDKGYLPVTTPGKAS